MARLFVTQYVEEIDPVTGLLRRVPNFDDTGITRWALFNFGETNDRLVVLAEGIDAAPAGTFDIGDPDTTIGEVLTGGRRNAFENRFGITLEADMTLGAALFLYHEQEGGSPIRTKGSTYRIALNGRVLYEQPVIAGGAATWLTDSMGGRTTGTNVDDDADWESWANTPGDVDFESGVGPGGEMGAALQVTASDEPLVYQTTTADPDMYVYATVNPGNPAGGAVGVLARWEAATGSISTADGYMATIATSGSLVLDSWVNGSYSPIASDSTPTFANDTEYEIILWAEGSEIHCSVTGLSAYCGTTNTATSTGNWAGFTVGGVDPATAPRYLRDFEALGGLIVQEAHSPTSLPNATSHDVDFAATPTSGNLIVAVIHARHTYANQTGVTTGYTSRAVGENTATSDYTEILTALPDGTTAYDNFQVTHSNSDAASVSVYEFAPPAGSSGWSTVTIEASQTQTQQTGTSGSLSSLTIVDDSLVFAAVGMRTATSTAGWWRGLESSYHVLGTTGQTYDACHGFAYKTANFTPTWEFTDSDTTVGSACIAIELPAIATQVVGTQSASITASETAATEYPAFFGAVSDLAGTPGNGQVVLTWSHPTGGVS
jgi:hypothetical protein